MIGSPAAITRLATETAFSSTRKPNSCDGAYGRSTISRKATSTPPTATGSASSGSAETPPMCTGRNATNANALSSTAIRIDEATPIPDGIRGSTSRLRSTNRIPIGNRSAFSAIVAAASTYSELLPRPLAAVAIASAATTTEPNE